jgi:hypothetical protein
MTRLLASEISTAASPNTCCGGGGGGVQTVYSQDHLFVCLEYSTTVYKPLSRREALERVKGHNAEYSLCCPTLLLSHMVNLQTSEIYALQYCAAFQAPGDSGGGETNGESCWNIPRQFPFKPKLHMIVWDAHRTCSHLGVNDCHCTALLRRPNLVHLTVYGGYILAGSTFSQAIASSDTGQHSPSWKFWNLAPPESTWPISPGCFRRPNFVPFGMITETEGSVE